MPVRRPSTDNVVDLWPPDDSCPDCRRLGDVCDPCFRKRSEAEYTRAIARRKTAVHRDEPAVPAWRGWLVPALVGALVAAWVAEIAMWWL